MKHEDFSVYERPESEEIILVHESSFLESNLENPFEQGEVDPNDPQP